MQLPSLESLRCLDAAAQLGSFRAAARTVALTPAALGQRIKQLEDQLGVRLFERTTRSMRLTPIGQAVLLQARATLAQAEAVLRAAREDAAAVPFDYTLGTRHELGLSFLLPLAGALEAACPGMTLHLYFGSGPDLLARLRARRLDAAITSSRVVDATLRAWPLHREDYVFVGAPRLLRHRPLLRPEDSAAHVLLDVDDELPLFRYWRDAPRAPDLRFLKLRRLGTIEAIRCLARAGEGVAVLPRYLVEPELKSGRLQVLLPRVRPLHDHFRLLSHPDGPRRATHAAVAQLLAASPLR